MSRNQLNELVRNMHIIQRSIPEDSSILVCSDEQILAYLPGESIDLNIVVGTPMTELSSTVSYKALREMRTLREERGPEQFGVSYIATSIPIFEETESRVVGVFTTILSNAKADMLRTGAEQLSAIVQEVYATAEEITTSAKGANRRILDMTNASASLSKQTEDIRQVTSFINKVASQTKMLGLNAAIEATNAGEKGKTFSIIAAEMRKLAEESRVSLARIEHMLEHISQSILHIDTTIHNVSTFFEEHASSLNDLNSAFALVTTTAESFIATATTKEI